MSRFKCPERFRRQARPGPRSAADNGNARGARCAIKLRIADLRIARNLAFTSTPAQLQHQFVNLAQAGSADGLAVGDEPAVGVDWQTAADLGDAIGNHLLLLTILAETVLGHVDDFGAGIGILMLATLGFLGFSDIHKMNTLKNVIGSLINLVAALWFTASGLINWPIMGVMTVGAVTGYYLGATYSQRLSQEMVRYLITAIGLIITVVMFWKLH